MERVGFGFKKLREDAFAPTKGKPGDSGWDLYLLEDFELKPMESKRVETGIAICLQPGFEAQIRPRSSSNMKDLHIFLGTIDSGYRGDMMVRMKNLSDQTLSFKRGDRVAQFVIQPVWMGMMFEVSELDQTDRGAAGFGSTGQ